MSKGDIVAQLAFTGRLIAVGFGVAATFIMTWRRLDDEREVENTTPEMQQLLETQFDRGIDGKVRLVSMNQSRRFAISLIGALMCGLWMLAIVQWILPFLFLLIF
jgi:hypothetical protein